MPEVSHSQGAPEPNAQHAALPPAASPGSFTSFATLWQTLRARRLFVLSVIGGLLLLCLLYCLIAPNQYEAKARVVLRVAPGPSLGLDDQASSVPSGSGGAILGLAEIETIANVFRGDRLAWRVILDHKLYRDSAFNGSFARRFPDFKPEVPNPAAQEYLLKRFAQRLHVSTVPRTLLVEIRFRTKDPALSAEVVAALIHAFEQEEYSMRVNETRTATDWLQGQLVQIQAQAAAKEREMEAFKRENGVMIAPGEQAGEQGSQGLPQLVEADEIARELSSAAAERVLREARYRAAMEGPPELVLDTDSPLLADEGNIEAAIFKQISSRRSDLDQQLAQLSNEYGPNYDRVVEVKQQLADLDAQLKTERARLLEMMRRSLDTARDRETMLRARLEEETGEGEKATDAAVRYQSMSLELSALRNMYIRIQGKMREAGLEAGVHPPDIWVVDPPIVPSKPAAPNLPLYMAVTLFVAVWLALGGALMLESLHPKALRNISAMLLLLLCMAAAHAQAPTPNTQGLPTGVTKVITPGQPGNVPDRRTSPPVWNGAAPAAAGLQESSVGIPMVPAQLSPGDMLDISEFHTPEFHSTVRISETGTVILPMIGEIKLAGLSETEASQAIASQLKEKGYLNHPQVFVLVTEAVGQDVSVLGEVTRPGVYPFTVHHRLLDLIAAASGLSPTAGGVVGIFHRDDPTPHIVSLRTDAAGADEEHNPELEPGDTVQVNRAGFIYVVGGVMRPGGFAMDPQQRLTVLQALSLAWGPSQSAATQKAVLIREQQGGGRLVTALNLKRMLRGQDPDLPLRERDILFIPDSLARSIWNHSLESAIQSAAGVSLYAGMVYSQRF